MIHLTMDEAVDLILTTELARVVARADRGVDEANTYGLPEGEDLADELKAWIARQKAKVLAWLPPAGETTAVPPDPPSLAADDEPMARACAPLLAVIWDSAGKAERAHLGLDPDDWRVTNPRLMAKIDAAALAFCSSTNATTSKELGSALKSLRAALTAGLVDQGDTLPELTKRVNAVFDRAEKWRARRIAATEASRAVHAATVAAAEESGVVAGFEWLVSDDACPLCRRVATEARRVKVGQRFAEVGSNPTYSDIRHPPLHPGCQCSLIEVLTPEYGGPVDPKWSETLIQPKVGPEGYTPPPGVDEPKPQPKAKRRPPIAPPPPPEPEPEPEPPPPPVSAEPTATPPPPPEPPKPKPLGTPVGQALDVKAKGAIGSKIDHAIKRIEKVHGDGNLPPIPVKSDGRIAANGQFRFSSFSGPVGIEINPKGASPALTAVHEIGHFLEMAAIPGMRPSGVRDWRNDPVFRPWLDAVEGSEGYRKLRLIHDTLMARHPAGNRPASVAAVIRYTAYLTDPRELWARSYAQYVAAKSGDPTLIRELDARRPAAPGPHELVTQWYDGDFAPIEKRIDELMAKLGWRR